MNKIFEQIDKLFEQTNKIVKRICLRPCRSKRNWRSLSVILVEVITKILVIKKEIVLLISVSSLSDMLLV